jgi:hypothetical protein
MKTDARYSVSKPEYLQIGDDSGNISYGFDQEWFGYFWQRMSGCGTIVAATLFHYMHKTGRIVLPVEVTCRKDSVLLINDVWKFVTPTTRGISTIKHFCGGVHDYIRHYSFHLECNTMDIPKNPVHRPSLEAVIGFIAQGLQNDCPVAFLNLSNGKVKALDSWHWVTIVSMTVSPENVSCSLEIYDGQKSLDIDLKCWMESTTLGGGFVYLNE